MIADSIATQATTVERTPNWMAPELLDPEKFGGTSSKPTMAGDIYSFGCTTIEVSENSIQKENNVLPGTLAIHRKATLSRASILPSSNQSNGWRSYPSTCVL